MTLLVAAVMAVALLLGARVADVSAASASAVHAQTAADAAALAGVWSQSLARDAAMRNGGTLIAFSRDGDTVSVLVEVDGAQRAASAD